MQENTGSKHGYTVTNTASGHVGIQAVHVSGSSVHFGSTGPEQGTVDLAAEIAAFRDELMRERAAGRIDDSTHRAAQAELDTATEALESDTAEDRNTFVLALKRLRGLVDLAEPAAKIAAVIATAQGMS